MSQPSTNSHELERPSMLDIREKQVEIATYGVLMHVPERMASAETLENSVPFVPDVIETPELTPEAVIEERIVASHETRAQSSLMADAYAQLDKIDRSKKITQN